MMLILASQGFSTPEIVRKCVELVGKPQAEINVAVINEAYAVKPGDHSWVIRDLSRIKDNFGGSIELVNLLALDIATVKERIGHADVIFVEGGNTDYLTSVFIKTGFSGILPELLKEKVYVGSSAGSMVLGRRVPTIMDAEAYRKGDPSYGIEDFLGFVDFSIRPHLGNHKPKNSTEIFLEAVKGSTGVIYGLSDDAAIVIDGEKQYMIGSEPIKIENGLVVKAKE